MSYIAERRLEEKERRRAEIVDAAEAAGREVGLDALTMDDVARRARLSRALLYVYFQDRSDLMFGLAERAMGMLHTRFLEAAERHRTGLEQVSAMGRAYVAFAQEFPVLFDALARCELETPDPAQCSPSEQACMIGGDKLQTVLVQSIETGVYNPGKIFAVTVPVAEAFDKAALRDGWAAEDFYLLLDGISVMGVVLNCWDPARSDVYGYAPYNVLDHQGLV